MVIWWGFRMESHFFGLRFESHVLWHFSEYVRGECSMESVRVHWLSALSVNESVLILGQCRFVIVVIRLIDYHSLVRFCISCLVFEDSSETFVKDLRVNQLIRCCLTLWNRIIGFIQYYWLTEIIDRFFCK